MPHPKRILLLDCDQFFVQCARLADPDGAGREDLLLVGGRAESRGVVTSASYPTRRFGVRSGMPMARALRLCPQARVVPVPGDMCARKSAEVRAVLGRFTPVVEAASIDEAYMDLTGTEALYHGEHLRDTALRIRAAVLEESGISTSLGGGTTRIVAKLASGRAKPAGVFVVEPGEEEAFMRGFALRQIPGVGPVFTEELRRWGLATVEEALDLPEETLVRRFGGRGAWLYQRVRGQDEGRVEPHAPAKSLSRDETFARDLHADDDLEERLLALVNRLGGDLRGKGLRARTITVRIRDSDFRTRQAGRTLPEPLEGDREILAVARQLLARLRQERRTGARLLSVAAASFDERSAPQLGLFEAEQPRAPEGMPESVDRERDRTLSRAVDGLRERFGRDAVTPARLLGGGRRPRPGGPDGESAGA